MQFPVETTSLDAVARAFTEFDPQTAEECFAAYSAKRHWLLAHQSAVEAVVSEWDAFTRSLGLTSPERFDEISHASGLPARAAALGGGYDDELLFWALRNCNLLRE